MSSVQPVVAFAVTLGITSIPGTYCPSIVPPVHHVASVEENEWCFYHPLEVIEQMPCKKGYYREFLSSLDSVCKICPENTFQPEKSNCRGCVYCNDCAKDGMVVKSNCTKTKDTECMDLPVLSVSTTTSKDDVEIESPPPVFRNQSSFTNTTSIQTKSSDPGPSEHDHTQKPDVQNLEKEDNNTVLICLAVFLPFVLLVTVGFASCHYMMQKKQKKIEKLKREKAEQEQEVAALKALLKKDEQEEGNDGQERYAQ